MPTTVEYAGDPRLAEYAGLRHRGHESDEWFIVESMMVVERLAGSPYPVRSVLVTPKQYARMEEVLCSLGAPVFVAEPAVMQEVAGYDLHRGVLASATRVPGPPLGDVLATARRLVVLEGSNDHENIGAVARSARALGFDAMVLDPSCADPLYRRSVRVSMGEILHLPIVRCAEWPDALRAMHAAGFETWALTPAADAESLFTMAMPDRLAVIAGAEGPGLSRAAMELATVRVRIPLHHDVDSLNLGHALAIAMAATSPPVD